MAATPVPITGANTIVGYNVSTPFTITDNFTFSFPYLSTDDFEIEVNTETLLDAADYEFTTDYLINLTTVGRDKLNALYATGTIAVVIRRRTQLTTRQVDFQDAAILTADELDLNSNQAFYLIQEVYDSANLSASFNPVDGNLDMANVELINVSEPTSLTSAATLTTVLANAVTPLYTTGDKYRSGRMVFNGAGDLIRANKDILDGAAFSAPAVLVGADWDDVLTAAQVAAIATNTQDLIDHEAATVVHGLTGNVVGDSDTQTLTNKTLTSPVVNTPTGIVKGDVGLGNVDNTSDATKDAAATTLTNKTITSPLGIVKADVGLTNVDDTSDATKNAAVATLTNKTFDDDVVLKEIATPSTPAAGYKAIYPKTDGKLYTLDDTGVEAEIGAGGGGGAGSSTTIHLLRANTDGGTDFTISSDTDVPDYAGADVLSATFEVPTTGSNAILSNDDAHAVYSLAGAASSQYDGQGIVLAIDKRARGKDVLVAMDYRTFKTTGDSSNGDYQLHIYDKTNATLLTDELTLFPANDSDTDKESTTFKKYVQIPSDCAEIVVFIQQRTADTDTTIFFDNILIDSDPFKKVETQEKEVAARYTTNSGQSIPDNTLTIIKYEDLGFDTNNAYDTSTGIYTVPKSGKYSIDASVLLINLAYTAGEVVSLSIYIGATQAKTFRWTAEAAMTVYKQYTVSETALDLEEGDEVTIRMTQITGSARTLDPGGEWNTFSIKGLPQKGTAIIVESADSVMSDWTSYDATLSSGSGVSAKSVFSRRVGDSLDVNGIIDWSSTGGGTIFTVALPSGLSMDSNKIGSIVSNESSLGIFQWKNSGTAFNAGNVLTNSSTSVEFIYHGDVQNLLGTGFASGDQLSFNFRVPIAGWSAVNKPLLAIPTVSFGQNAEEYNAYDYAGHGSTNTNSVYFTNVVKNTISNLGTVTNDATSGFTFTATARCRVEGTFYYAKTTGGEWMAMVRDGSLTVASTSTGNDGKRIGVGHSSASGITTATPFSGILEAGQVISPITDGTSGGAVNNYNVGLSLKVEPELGQQNHAAIISAPVAFVKDVKADTVVGGTATSGNDASGFGRQRTLNTLSGDIAAVGVSLASNTITLGAGKYLIKWRSPHYADGNGLIQAYTSFLYNATDSVLIEQGSSEHYERISSASVASGASEGETLLTITKSTDIQVQYWVATTAATNGLGAPSSSGHNEIYTQVKITRKS